MRDMDVTLVLFKGNTDYKHFQSIPALWESRRSNICPSHTHPPDLAFDHLFNYLFKYVHQDLSIYHLL